jgi:hypothetical protein
MSLEMVHKVIVPQKKIMSRSFLNSGTLIVIISLAGPSAREWARMERPYIASCR